MKRVAGLKIEKGTPIPLSKGLYPWNDMDVGDSFFVPESVRSPASVVGYISTKNFLERRKVKGKPRQYAGRKEAGGCRVWRVA